MEIFKKTYSYTLAINLAEGYSIKNNTVVSVYQTVNKSDNTKEFAVIKSCYVDEFKKIEPDAILMRYYNNGKTIYINSAEPKPNENKPNFVANSTNAKPETSKPATSKSDNNKKAKETPTKDQLIGICIVFSIILFVVIAIWMIFISPSEMDGCNILLVLSFAMIGVGLGRLSPDFADFIDKLGYYITCIIPKQHIKMTGKIIGWSFVIFLAIVLLAGISESLSDVGKGGDWTSYYIDSNNNGEMDRGEHVYTTDDEGNEYYDFDGKIGFDYSSNDGWLD